MTSLALSFNDVQLSPITHNSQIYLTSSELASSLGYADEGGVRKIFNRYKDEFTDTMSTVLRSGQIDPLGESSGLQTEQRIFSLRGCHLLAMFSRTAIAKDFRKWVLDVLDGQSPILQSIPSPYISESEAQQFKKSMEAHCKQDGKSYSVLYRKAYDYFGITSYKNIPAGKLEEAARICGFKLLGLDKLALPHTEQLPHSLNADLVRILTDRIKALEGELLPKEIAPQTLTGQCTITTRIHFDSGTIMSTELRFEKNELARQLLKQGLVISAKASIEA